MFQVRELSAALARLATPQQLRYIESSIQKGEKRGGRALLAGRCRQAGAQFGLYDLSSMHAFDACDLQGSLYAYWCCRPAWERPQRGHRVSSER